MNPPVDPESLATLRALSPEEPGFLRDLIDVFLEDSPRRFAELEQGLASGNAATVQRAAHTLKGSAGHFGAAELATRASEIEALGRSGALAEAGARLAGLREEYERVAQFLREHR